MTEVTDMEKPQAGRRQALMSWMARGPFAIAASTLQGGMNYFIVLYLTFFASLTATGEYRLLFSFFTLLSFPSMLESNKVFIRCVVTEDREGATAIVATRLFCSFLAFFAVTAIWAIGKWIGHSYIPDVVVPLGLITAMSYPFDLYIAELQARRRFQKLFLLEVIKYGGSLAAFMAVYQLTGSLTAAVLTQVIVMGFAFVGFFMIYARRYVDFGRLVRHFLPLQKEEAAVQTRTYSFANMIPSSIEHVDKLLVGAVFGLEFLGVYTLAYSTGRFVYNVLKPAMYIYYRRFVDEMPGWPLLIRVSLIATVVGFINSVVFLLAIRFIPAMHKFDSGKWATVILFLNYGTGLLHAVYSQAFSLNKESIARQSFVAHALASAGSLVVLGAALLSPKPLALILLAVQYPVRDGGSIFLLDRFRKKSRMSLKPD